MIATLHVAVNLVVPTTGSGARSRHAVRWNARSYLASQTRAYLACASNNHSSFCLAVPGGVNVQGSVLESEGWYGLSRSVSRRETR